MEELMPSRMIHRTTDQHETANWFLPQHTAFVHNAYGLIHACPTVKLFLEGESRSHKMVVLPIDSVRILRQIKTKR